MYSGVPHIVLCVCFVFLRLVYTMMPFSLDCPFLIAPSVFSNVYLPLASTWDHTGFRFLVGSVLLTYLDFFALLCLPLYGVMCPKLLVSLYCPFLIAASVFSNVYWPMSFAATRFVLCGV